MENEPFIEWMSHHFTIFQDDNGIDFSAKTKGNVDIDINIYKHSKKSYHEQFEQYVNEFDVDWQIDFHREDKEYRNSFTVRESVADFEEFEKWLKSLLKQSKHKRKKLFKRFF